MSPLDRKLLRELWQIRAQVAAIALVVASGIGAFVGMTSAWASLDRARADFYARGRFADVFASLVRAPLPVAREIAEIPGVEAVLPRILANVHVDVEGYEDPITGIFISLPQGGRPPINDLHLRRGSWPAPERDDQVLVHEAFAQAHELEPGDSIEGIIEGRLQRLTIAGIVLSPEFVYQVPPGSLFPDDERSGVFWMNERALGRAFDMEGAFNDVVIRLGRGASEAAVIARLDRILEPWGGLGAYAREDQASNLMLSEELRGLQTQAVVVTTIFLGVASFLLQLVLGRIIAGQREVIAVLKALGYPTRTVGLHYLKMVAVVSLIGGVLGALLGVGMGRLMIEAYRPFFRFPTLDFLLRTDVLVAGLLVATVSGLVATVGSVRRVVRLPPAVAMKPPAPARYRATLFERLGLGGVLPPAARMVMRRLERTPVKSALSVVGISFSLGILVASSGLLGSIDRLVDVAFRQEQRQDATVVLVEAQDEGILHEIDRLPGVLQAEPMRTVAVRLRNGWRQHNLALQGLPPGGELRRILGAETRPVGLPPAGMILSRELGDRLGASPGDLLQVEVLEGERPTLTLPIAGLVEDRVGLNAWISLDALHEALGQGRRISGANVRIDPLQRQAFLDATEEAPLVAGVQLRTALVETFEETMGETQDITMGILTFFASIIAVGVVYNTARILLADSSRELASLRVLGFTRGEISRIFLGELAVLVLAALPLGVVLGRMLGQLIVSNLPAELYRITLYIPPAAIVRSIAVVLVAALASALVVRRRLDRLDLVGVLKTRE